MTIEQVLTARFQLARLFLVGFGSCALLAACSTPQKHHRWNPNGAPQAEASPAASILKYDANHDGILTRDELETGLKADFNAFDTRHTGCLTPDQVTAINEARASADQAASSPLIDWKHNGCVDLEEFAATARSIFEQLDKNGDGKLTPDELQTQKKGNGNQGGATQGQQHHRGRRGGGGGQSPDGD
jgi:EF hand